MALSLARRRARALLRRLASAGGAAAARRARSSPSPSPRGAPRGVGAAAAGGGPLSPAGSLLPVDLTIRLTVAVGVSGGVDSAVAAALLRAGASARGAARVVGAHMRNWDAADEGGDAGCEAAAEREDARRVAAHLRLELAEVDLSREYWHDVFAPTVEAYAQGLTPNPDAACNVHVKFGAFAAHCAEKLGADLVATGHYAGLAPRCEAGTSSARSVRLLRGADAAYDQSYFLAAVRGEALAGALFPLGGMLKSEVRRRAEALGLHVAQKKTSTGLCFVGRRRFGDLLGAYASGGLEEGCFVDVSSGEAVGRHHGAARYTFGQRARLGGSREAYFVAGKDIASRVVYVAREGEADALLTRGAAAGRFSWVGGAPPAEALSSPGGLRCEFKARYATPSARCTVWDAASVHAPRLRPSLLWRASDDALHRVGAMTAGDGRRGVVVTFEQPAKTITPGQMLVLYSGEECLGGGPIEHIGQSVLEERQAATQHARMAAGATQSMV